VYYCSRECQVADWTNHKAQCKLAKAANEANKKSAPQPPPPTLSDPEAAAAHAAAAARGAAAAAVVDGPRSMEEDMYGLMVGRCGLTVSYPCGKRQWFHRLKP